MSTEPRSSKLTKFAWCLFDFANSSFPTVALTAFGAPYFVSVIAAPEPGTTPALGATALWGLTMSLAMVIVTLSSPIMGALADCSGKKRSLLAVYVLICVAATAGLAFVPPHAALLGAALYIVAVVAFEGSYVFYNAFLPELGEEKALGRLSAYGWAFGYVGGLLALILCRPFMPEAYDPAHAARASKVFLIVAGWFLVFSVPALVILKDSAPTGVKGQSYVAQAFSRLRATFAAIRTYHAVVIFLVGYFIYTDAITTVIEFTGIYTKEVLAFTPKENVSLFLLLNVVAAPGALLFGFIVDRLGAKRAVRQTLVVWMLVVLGAALATSRTMFWPVAGLAAIVLGATQAASRVWMIQLSPENRRAEFMGFLSFSGKASAIVGPTLYGWVAQVADSPASPGRGHRLAIGILGTFFVIAWWVLRKVPDAPVVDNQAD